MSKELPYFKFFSTEWLLGRITDRNYRLQGIFISACAHYWHKDCTISEVELNQKLGKSRVKLLIDEKFILQSNGEITIAFLDEQMSEFIDLKEKRSKAGKKGGQASVKQRSSKNKAKVGYKEKEVEIEKEKEIDKRKRIFANQLTPCTKKYGKETVRKFYDYWTELNKSGTKMRFEMEGTWELGKRLARWKDNNFNKSGPPETSGPFDMDK